MPYCISQQELDLSRHEIVSGPHIGGCPDCGSSTSSDTGGSSDNSSASSDSNTSSSNSGLSSGSSASSVDSSASSDSSGNSRPSSSSSSSSVYEINGSAEIVTKFVGDPNCAGASIGSSTNGWLPFSNFTAVYGTSVALQNGGTGPQFTISGVGPFDSFGFPASLAVTVQYGSANAAPACLCPGGTAWSATINLPRDDGGPNSTPDLAYYQLVDIAFCASVDPAITQNNTVASGFFVRRLF